MKYENIAIAGMIFVFVTTLVICIFLYSMKDLEIQQLSDLQNEFKLEKSRW